MRRPVILLCVVWIVSSCGTDQPGAITTAPPAAESTTTPGEISTTTTPSVTSTSGAGATTTTVTEVDIEIIGDEVVGPVSFEVALGERVDIWVLSDSDDELHVHGYDLFFDLVSGVPFNLTFEADVPGVFEVETHERAQPLFEIEVTG